MAYHVPSITLQDNTFAWNDASQNGGAQSWASIHTAQHTRNSFYRNSARTGGAIAFQDCLATTYTGAGNESPSATALPGGVNYGYNHPNLTDNTFTENSAWTTNASVTGVSAGAVSLTNSSVWVSGGTF